MQRGQSQKPSDTKRSPIANSGAQQINNTASGQPARPKTLICYICGREYGSASLEIHLKTCKKKWEQEQEKKPVNQRRPCPEPPQEFNRVQKGMVHSESAVGQYNDAAFGNYNERGLEPCPKCGRTFLPESLKRHIKGCHAKGEAPEKTQTPKLPAAKPKALICYICGREYGSASLEIHLKACTKKWEQEQEKKPAHMRKPCPAPPENLGLTIEKAKGGNFDDNYNQAAFDNFNSKALEPCPKCGRTFLPESLQRHLKGCHAKGEAPQET